MTHPDGLEVAIARDEARGHLATPTSTSMMRKNPARLLGLN